MENVNFLAYKNAVKQAWKDGKVTSSEFATLETVRKSLNISAEDHIKIEKEVQQELEAQGITLETTESPPAPSSDTQTAPTEPIVEPPPPPPSKLQDQEFFEAGKEAYDSKDYSKALDFFNKVLTLNPGNDRAQFYKKRSLSKLPDDYETQGSSGLEQELGATTPTEQISALGNPGSPLNNSGTLTAEPNASSAEVESAGKSNCSSCNDTGQCKWCEATGNCNWCNGTGKCKKCDGTGVTDDKTCSSCKGEGECFSCKGSGKCFWCKGSGKCNKCS